MYRTIDHDVFAPAAPAHIARVLLRRGGRNPYGEAMYRTCRTEARKRLSCGVWREWPTGMRTRYKNAGLNRAVRAYLGLKAVPMYPGEHGWVLERWCRAEDFGSPVQWYSPMSMGGTKRWMGPDIGYVLSAGHYPYRGDYQGTGYIFPGDALTETLVAHAVGRIEYERDGAPMDAFRRAKIDIALAQKAEEKEEAEWTRYFLDEATAAVKELDARTPEARAEVQKYLQESLGITEHAFN